MSLLKLDLGCGMHPKDGFVGVDIIKFSKVSIQHDLRELPWPFEDASVGEAHCRNLIEYLTNLDGRWERVKFFNELYRVMVGQGKLTLTVPHWCSTLFYGSPCVKEVWSERSFFYLDPRWRAKHAPETDIRWNEDGYACWWECTWGYVLHPQVNLRNEETQMMAIQYAKEACQEIVATLIAREA